MVAYALPCPFYDGEEDDNMARWTATAKDGGLEISKTVFARRDIGRMKKRQAQALGNMLASHLLTPQIGDLVFVV